MPNSFRNRFLRSRNSSRSKSNFNSSSNNGMHTQTSTSSSAARITGIFGRGNSNSSSSLQLDYPPLSAFDACIEACDALVSSSSHHMEQQRSKKDYVPCDSSKCLLPDCSVLVSPEGALLFTASTIHPPGSHAVKSIDSVEKSSNCRYPWTSASSEYFLDPTIMHEEYESAILCGNDLTSNGEYDSNGFSARGWDVNAASLALDGSKEVLKCMQVFVEELALCRKEEGARLAGSCGKLDGGLENVIHAAMQQNNQPEQKQIEQQQQLRGRRINGMNSRVGPILFSGSTLSIALEAMEQYFSISAQALTELWREACLDEHHHKSDPSVTQDIMEGAPRSIDGNYNDDTKLVETKKVIPISFIQGILPKLRYAAKKAEDRTQNRNTALNEIRTHVAEAEENLKKQKESASTLWQRVKLENAKIDEIVAQHVREQNELMQMMRLKNETLRLEQDISEPAGLENDIWEMVKGVGSMEEFQHTGFSPRAQRKNHSTNASAEHGKDNDKGDKLIDSQVIATPPHVQISRADVEKESDLQELRMSAVAADDAVEDAAGALLNILSKYDTTIRSARVAAETGLLSQCNAVQRCLRSLVAIERASLQERLESLQKFEAAVETIDVRKDIDNFIVHDKMLQGSMSHSRDNDDGGIAAALAVLNSHLDENTGSNRVHIERPNYFKGWSDTSEDDGNEIEPDFFGVVIKMIFDQKSLATQKTISSNEASIADETQQKLEDAIFTLSTALSEKSHQGQIARQAVLYELNNQRSVKTHVEDKSNFESLCYIFNSFLTGCGRDYIDVSNAKMLMILSQTFFFVDHHDRNDGSEDTRKVREKRIYVKNKISSHCIWSDEELWDQALFQCVTESLKKSGVLLNYTKSKDDESNERKQLQMKWHDLSPNEYADAAAQVHSVVFAQLGTLSHSMLELGCGIPRACSFVRRLSIRYQLPLSLRITLIQHLMKSINRETTV